MFLGLNVNAQNKKGSNEDASRIVLNTYLGSELPSAARNILKRKLSSITMKNGVGGESISPRFIITSKIDVLSKDITPTAPPMTALTLGVTILVGDAIQGTKFGSEYVEVKGVGTNKTKAYLSSIKRLNVNKKEFKDLIENSKKKIIDYYNTNCEFILTDAKTLVSTKEYDEAIFKLASVPSVSKKCYMKSSAMIANVYTKKINFDCKSKLNEAKAVWNAGLNRESAESASDILSEIDPESSCYNAVKKQYAIMAARVKLVDKREWNYVVKEQLQESERIEAIRAIGVAKGRNQPKTIYKTNLISRW